MYKDYIGVVEVLSKEDVRVTLVSFKIYAGDEILDEQSPRAKYGGYF